MKWMAFFLSLLVANVLWAKPQLDPKIINFIVDNCFDNKGHKVDFVFHRDIDGDMYASTHQTMTDWQGNQIVNARYLPVIRINLKNFLADSVPGQAFSLGHECGHQVLGHVWEGGDSHPREEFEADCWAIHLLVKNKIISSKEELVQIERDFEGYYDNKPYHRSQSHPGTIERFNHIHQCFDEAKGNR